MVKKKQQHKRKLKVPRVIYANSSYLPTTTDNWKHSKWFPWSQIGKKNPWLFHKLIFRLDMFARAHEHKSVDSILWVFHKLMWDM